MRILWSVGLKIMLNLFLRFTNIHNKKDTFTVEDVNADLRHYIPTLARRSRCFPPKAEESPGGPRCLLFMLIIVLAVRRIATAPAILGPLFPLSLFDFF